MILKNNSLASTKLFCILRPFPIPFTLFQYFSCAWRIDECMSAMWKTGITNNKLGRRKNTHSCNWGRNI